MPEPEFQLENVFSVVKDIVVPQLSLRDQQEESDDGGCCDRSRLEMG